jgi:TctA family transporter
VMLHEPRRRRSWLIFDVRQNPSFVPIFDNLMSATFPIIAVVLLAVAVVVSLVWVGRDAQRTGRSSLRIVLLCFLTWPLGFVVWRGIRPPPPIR